MRKLVYFDKQLIQIADGHVLIVQEEGNFQEEQPKTLPAFLCMVSHLNIHVLILLSFLHLFGLFVELPLHEDVNILFLWSR